MGGLFFPDLQPKYGLDPDSGKEYWPQEKTGYEKSTNYWLDAAWEEARYELNLQEESTKIGTYIDYIIGNQWPKGRPSYKSVPVNNRCWRLFWELVSLLTDIKPIFDVRTDNKDYSDHAKMLNKVVRSWWMSSQADMAFAKLIIYGLLTTGYGHQVWNNDLRHGEGDIELRSVGPLDVLPLKVGDTLQSAEACIYRATRPISWFRRHFPFRGRLVQPDENYSRFTTGSTKPGDMPSLLWDMLSPQMRYIVGGETKLTNSAFPMALYREFWIKDRSLNSSNKTVLMGKRGTNWCYEVKPNEPLYPRGRLLIKGGDVLLEDSVNPYWHGMYPFSAMRMNIVPWQFLGLSEMRSMLPLQDIINNLLAGIMDMVKKAVNPGFYGPKNAFSDSMWDSLDWSMPGIKAGYSQTVAQAPQFQPAPNLPGYVFQMLNWSGKEMNESSGIAAISEAMGKKQVPAGDTLDIVKDMKQTPVRLKGRNAEVCLRDLGDMAVWNIFQFYTLKRRMQIAGNDGKTFEDYDWDPNTAVPAGIRAEDHAKRFSFYIQPGSLLNIRHQEQLQIIRALRMNRDIDRRTMYTFLDLGVNVDKIEEGLKKEAQEGIPGGKPQRGRGGAQAAAPKK